MSTTATSTRCPRCASPYLTAAAPGTARLCTTCGDHAEARLRVAQAEALREIAHRSDVGETGAVWIEALFAGAAALDQQAATIEHVAQRMIRHHHRPEARR